MERTQPGLGVVSVVGRILVVAGGTEAAAATTKATGWRRDELETARQQQKWERRGGHCGIQPSGDAGDNAEYYYVAWRRFRRIGRAGHF